MIQPTELRIGNYIWNPIQKLSFKVDATVLSDLYYTSIGARNKQVPKDMQYQPIPLTEEWLIKFGFDCSIDPEEAHYSKKADVFTFTIKRKIGFEVFFIENEDITTQVMTVNKLQNIFYFLTGEELKLKEI